MELANPRQGEVGCEIMGRIGCRKLEVVWMKGEDHTGW
jgi:hypothetical protein